jgi:hypothetical protein
MPPRKGTGITKVGMMENPNGEPKPKPPYTGGATTGGAITVVLLYTVVVREAGLLRSRASAKTT